MSESLGSIHASQRMHEVIEKNASLKKVDNKGDFLAIGCSAGQGAITLALFIIGCFGAVGQLSAVVMGGCAVGLGVPLLLMAITKALCLPGVQDKVQAVASAVLMLVVVVLGALGISGVVSASAIGWAVVTPTLVNLVIGYCASSACAAVLCATITSTAASNN
jgi:hypothetical protein